MFILFIMSAFYRGGVAMTTIEGFKTMKECQVAGQVIQKQNAVGSWSCVKKS